MRASDNAVRLIGPGQRSLHIGHSHRCSLSLCQGIPRYLRL